MGMLVAVPAAVAEETDEAGNNLSYPTLWAEALSATRPTVPGVVGEELFGDVVAGTVSPEDPTPCLAAVQKSAANSWQAANADVAGVAVTHVDWGDNLEAKDWNVGAKVRVETVLFDNALTAPMTGYEMCYVSGAMSQTELWGAKVTGGDSSAVLTEDVSAIIYSDGGRLTIQRITDPETVSWSSTEHQWVGAGAVAPLFNAAVHERTSDGPGSYAAELNIKGRIVYGTLWDTAGLYNGEYRLTFSLDGPMDGFAGSGTNLDTAQVLVPVEEELEAVAAPVAGSGNGRGPGDGGSGGEGAGNVAVVAGGVTYIDVALSGGADAPVEPVDPGDEPTTPPATGGGATTTVAPPAPGPAMDSEQTGPQAGQPEEVSVPQAATALIRQRAKLGLPKSGTSFVVGRKLVLAKSPLATTAGVTVRWRVTAESREFCSITTLKGTKVPQNRGRVVLTPKKPGPCTVVAWAPAPSPEYEQYRKTLTYRIGW